MPPKRKRAAPAELKPAAVSKVRRVDKTVEASVTMELEVEGTSETESSDEEEGGGNGSDSSSEELLPVPASKSRAAAKKPTAAATATAAAQRRAPSPAKPAYNRGKSPSGRAVLNVRAVDSSPRAENDEGDGYTVVDRKKKKIKEKKEKALESLPKEHTHSRKLDASSEGGDDAWTQDVDAYSLCSSVNMYTTTAIDDEQVIAYALMKRGIFPQWLNTCRCVFWTTTPLFLLAALGCYLLGGVDWAQVGVAMLLVWLATQVLVVLTGLPLVLLQRILASLSNGRNSELEMLCLFLSVVVMVCVSTTYNAIRGGRCGVLWCEGDTAI